MAKTLTAPIVPVTGPLKVRRQRVHIISAAAQAKKDGLLKKGMTKDEIVQTIAACCLDDDPVTYADPKFDWQSFLDLIMQLMPLIMILFGL